VALTASNLALKLIRHVKGFFSHGCCLATSHSTKIRPQQNTTPVNSPIFSSSITRDHCSDPCAIRSHDFPCHHPVTALSSWPVTRYSLWRSSLSVSRNVVKIGQTVSEGRSTCGTHSLNCNIKLFQKVGPHVAHTA
jgi:hypothetical protein